MNNDQMNNDQLQEDLMEFPKYGGTSNHTLLFNTCILIYIEYLPILGFLFELVNSFTTLRKVGAQRNC